MEKKIIDITLGKNQMRKALALFRITYAIGFQIDFEYHYKGVSGGGWVTLDIESLRHICDTGESLISSHAHALADDIKKKEFDDFYNLHIKLDQAFLDNN